MQGHGDRVLYIFKRMVFNASSFQEPSGDSATLAAHSLTGSSHSMKRHISYLFSLGAMLVMDPLTIYSLRQFYENQV
jgi:hypothetical protein